MTTRGHAPRSADPDQNDARPDRPIADIEVRHLRTSEEFAACVKLQHLTWGAGFSEQVPAAILKVSQRIGGITAGAFDAHGAMVGFVFGLTGIENHDLVHWSDMLAVRADRRDQGIGRLLKEFQLRALLELGVTRIYWTFDPLVARNAHLNFNRLGVQVAEYVTNMYGDETDSVLHRGLGTDRFIVVRPIAGEDGGVAVHDRGSTQPLVALAHDARVLNTVDANGIPTLPHLPTTPIEAMIRIAIPLEIEKVQATDLSLAARWRDTTRRAILWSMGHGYRVAGFYRDDATNYGFYVLSTSPQIQSPASHPASQVL